MAFIKDLMRSIMPFFCSVLQLHPFLFVRSRVLQNLCGEKRFERVKWMEIWLFHFWCRRFVIARISSSTGYCLVSANELLANVRHLFHSSNDTKEYRYNHEMFKCHCFFASSHSKTDKIMQKNWKIPILFMFWKPTAHWMAVKMLTFGRYAVTAEFIDWFHLWWR